MTAADVTADQVRSAEAFVTSFNEREWQAMRSLLASDCLYQEITKPAREARGADAIVDAFQAWAAAAQDIRGSVANVVAGGDKVAIEVALEGPMRGPFGNFSPARRGPIAQGAFFFAFTDRFICELRLYYDSLALFQILGIRP